MGDIIRILHLSDIHLDKDNWKIDDTNGDKSNDDRYNFDKFKEELINFLDVHEQWPDFIIITGDLVNKGEVFPHFKIMLKFFNELVDKLNIPKENIIIVPGNHDLDRNRDYAKDRLSNFKTFLDKFYGQNSDYSIDIDPESLEIEKSKWEYNYKIGTNKLRFIPLYSPLIEPDKKIPERIKRVLKEELSDEEWFDAFDRGLIEEYQLKKISEIPDKDDEIIRICLFHHHPLSISRPSKDFSDNYFPELNILSNGAEVIKSLGKKGVDIIFHGHRHQNSIFQLQGKSIAIIGAPSVIKQEGSHHKQLPGFNMLEIVNNHSSLKLEIKHYSVTSADEGGVEIELNEKDSESLRIERNKLEDSIISYQDGLNGLAQQILNSDKGETILHYRPDATWKEKNRDNKNPFDILLDDLITNEKAFNDFLSIMSEGKERKYQKDLKKTIVDGITNLTNSQNDTKNYLKLKKETFEYYKRIFEHRFHNSTSSINDLFRQERPFVNFLKNPKNEDRRNLYALETFKCLIDNNWHVHKSIYFVSETVANLEYGDIFFKTEECQKKMSSDRKKKFKWLLDSLLELSLIENYQLTWLPYHIKGFSLKSIVAFKYNPAHTMMIGFQEDRDGEYGAVLNIGANLSGDENLYNDLKSLMSKNIYPLTNFLLKHLPILRNNTIHLTTLKVIEQIYGIDNLLLEDFIKSLKEIPDINSNIKTDIKTKIKTDISFADLNKIAYTKFKEHLEILNNWILTEDDFSFGNKVLKEHRDYWSKEEKVELLNRLESIISNKK